MGRTVMTVTMVSISPTSDTSKKTKPSVEEMGACMQTGEAGGALSGKSISISVQLLNGETIIVDTHDDATVEQLQEITNRRVDVSKGTLRLMKEDGSVLEAAMTLQEAGVAKKAVLCAVIDEAQRTHSQAAEYIGRKQGPFTKGAQNEEWRRLQKTYADPYNCCFDDPTRDYGVPTSMM